MPEHKNWSLRYIAFNSIYSNRKIKIFHRLFIGKTLSFIEGNYSLTFTTCVYGRR